MNRQDYIDLGRKDGREGSPNNRLYSSWQDKAYQEGYAEGIAVYRERGLKMAADVQSMETAKRLETVGRYSQIGDSRINADGSRSELVDNGDGTIGTKTTGIPWTGPVIHDPKATVPIPNVRHAIPQAVIEHINFLARQRATCTDEKKRARLLDKSIALKNKWSKRAFAAYDRQQRA